MSVEKQKEREELDRLKKRSVALERDAGDLPVKVEQVRARDEEQQQRTTMTRMKVEKQGRVHKMEVEELWSTLQAYQRALGLTIRRDSNQNLHFMFTHVDDDDLDAQFSFVIRVEDEECQTVSLVSCTPPLHAAPSFIEAHNLSKNPNKISTLVRIFRREFKSSLSPKN